MNAVTFTSPVGRIVQGNLYVGSTKDAEGKPLVVKTGANAGQPRVDFFFAIAIPKGSETHWNQTKWGATIWKCGQESFPGGQANLRGFAWKVRDGDSEEPDTRGRPPRDREGFPGHWVLSFSSGYAPKTYYMVGRVPHLLEGEGQILPGYYVQVAGNVVGNGSLNRPGVLVNHGMVARIGYGPEIVFGPDPTSAGFGQEPMPSGASATPVGTFQAAAGAVADSIPTTGGGYASAPPPPPITPNRAFLMLPAAGGATHDAMIAQGWTDAQLVQHGMMAA